VLACLDGYLNIAMEQTEEYVDGQLKAKYGDCFIRGNNGTFSSRQWREQKNLVRRVFSLSLSFSSLHLDTNEAEIGV
jgi:hypothetical protein